MVQVRYRAYFITSLLGKRIERSRSFQGYYIKIIKVRLLDFLIIFSYNY